MKDTDKDYYIMFYILIIYSFNNQIRFNRNGEFNLPVGKRDFNKNMERKFNELIDRIQSINCELLNKDFRVVLDNVELTSNSLVYVDPLYLITCATYNENGGWSEQGEYDLFDLLDNLHAKGIRFSLSNVLWSKGKENKLLIEWIERNNDSYKVIYLDYNYSNPNYQTKDCSNSTEEVLIINY